jgi:hypothetical protein
MKKRMSLQDKAFLAMQEAVKEVIEKHKKSGRPLPIWKDGKVVYLPVKHIK